ncbi:family 43 glycosylhydrolase [Mongoliitalea daihaiensis]|nr:family 43 glycosylhydrolase [Mongoliitalea daihaiensis]
MFLWTLLFIQTVVFAQNPLVRHQFSADPSAKVFGDRIYIYASHDIRCDHTQGRPDWFCMEDYHVFSSDNLIDWEDHGMALHQSNVPWADQESYSMWAPDGAEKNGKYYFYFPSKAKGHLERQNDPTVNGSAFNIGVAIGDNPGGPFIPESNPIPQVYGIDPNVFIDKDGQAYLYWSQHDFFVAKLKENMLELAEEPRVIENIPSKGLKEGPFLFERNGIYYLTYPRVENQTERIEYATANHPLGPFEYKGVIMDESPTGCWTNHQSVAQFKGQWYFFYHHNDFSPDFDKNRSIRADSLHFTVDGLIKKVTPTHRGIGVSNANRRIHPDRYSSKSAQGYTIEFLNEDGPFDGWKSVFTQNNSWVRYNKVDFGTKELEAVKIRVNVDAEGTLQVRSALENGKLIAEIPVKPSGSWVEIQESTSAKVIGLHDLVFVYKGSGNLELDWVTFL